jgi:hypothetical protein
MDEELDKTLVEKFPKLFVDRYKSAQETCMCWGFNHGNGWYNLVDSLCTCIQHYLDYKPEISQVIIDQVKEKYGSLRFYFHGGDEYVQGLVTMVEYLSASTCEICGNPGKIENDSWIKVRCDKCSEQKSDQ